MVLNVLTSSARLLRLLSLLQSRPEWRGADLATELDVTTRTVRRDIDRLRELGYPISGRPGDTGGYRLGPGAAMPPLLLDDEEAVAVAVGLKAVASGAITGVAESSARALAKLEQLLPSRLRQRVTSLATATTSLPQPTPGIDADVLALIAGACRSSEALRFRYRTRTEDEGSRHAEPYRLVHTGRRWYLMAWDVEREDWRTYRVDRMAQPYATGRRFNAREAPDAAAFVQAAVSTRPYRHHIRVRLRAPLSVMGERIPPEVGVLTAVDERTCELTTGAESLDWAAMHIATLDVEFEVIEPAELTERMASLAKRLDPARSGSEPVVPGLDGLDRAADPDGPVRPGLDDDQ